MRGLNMRLIVGGLLMLCLFSSAHAGISLSATRLVFEKNSHEASVTARNHTLQNILLQSWIEQDDKKAKDIPFVITPSLARLSGDGRQILRVLYRGQGMPRDKESVLWLNVQEIPQAAKDENTLQIAIRQRIKIFYRPTGLKGDADSAPALLSWQLTQQDANSFIAINNPTQYHISMLSLEGIDMQEPFTGQMFEPGTTTLIPIMPIAEHAHSTVRFQTVNDWGALVPHHVRVDFSEPRTGSKELVTP
ncbi:MAG: molecular chaperone [Pseudomonadota bacterium]